MKAFCSCFLSGNSRPTLFQESVGVEIVVPESVLNLFFAEVGLILHKGGISGEGVMQKNKGLKSVISRSG